MANLEELKHELTAKELEFRNFCDSLSLKVAHSKEDDAKRESMKLELQELKDQIIALDDSNDEEDWETEAEELNTI
jgi:hypothetical protein